MKRMETPDKFHLNTIIDDIRNGKYVIPDFQREFEWTPWDLADLLKSIFKDYYVGTLLLWKADSKNVEALSCEPLYGFEGKINPDNIVLDGQQRLSALHYALFAPNAKYPNRANRCFFFLKIDDFLNENIDDAIYYDWGSKKIANLLENKELQFEQRLFPFSVLSNKQYDHTDWLADYRDYWENKGKENIKEERKELRDKFKELLFDYEISYIRLDREIQIAKVCDIFTKINSTGIPLNIFDLLNAILKPKDIKLKEMWRNVSSDFNGTIEAKNILQTMSILKQGYCSPSYLYYLVPGESKTIKLKDGSKDKIILIEEKDEFIKLWNHVVESIGNTLRMIENPRDYGAIVSRFIPYPTMIPIITALNIEKNKKEYQDKQGIDNKIKIWYWSSVFTKNYSSSVESRMAKDYEEVKKWFRDDKEIPQVVNQCNVEINNLDLANERTQSSAVYKAIFNLLILKGAKDWDSFELPEYSNLHDHHIIPNSWGKNKKSIQINTILNRTPLSDVTNKYVINDKLPNVYIKKIFEKTKDKEEVYKLFETHLVSREAIDILLRENFTEKDFQEFIEERKKMIMKEVKLLVGNLSSLEKGLENDPNKIVNHLEKKLRAFIDKVFSNTSSSNYWKEKIPGDIVETAKERANVYAKKNPDFDISNITNLQRLDFCDIMHYSSIILKNWDDFEDSFKSKGEVEKRFNNLKEYRNALVHSRKINNIIKKEGEAAIEWIEEILK